MTAVLGVDLASASWAANGSALIEWSRDRRRVTRVEAGVAAWPQREPIDARAMAVAIDACARRHGVRVVAIDGPHAWRDAARGVESPGVGRWSEYLVRAQGKTGVCGRAYPRTQLAWTAFSIAVFDALLEHPDVRLAEPEDVATPERPFAADPGDAPVLPAPADAGHESPRQAPADAGGASVRGGYVVCETYPTATWRAAGLTPLPAKSRRPDVRAFYRRLADAFALPPCDVDGHDDLQAVVAALAGVGVAGGPTRGDWRGHPCRVDGDGVRVEGGIWVASPLVSGTVPILALA